MDLRTERLRLRPPRNEDLQAVHGFLSDPRAMHYWSSLPHQPLADTQTFLDGLIHSDRGQHFYAVFEMDGVVIGMGGYSEKSEIVLILHPSEWRKGIGREVLSALISHGFRTFEFNSITADVDPENAASIALLSGLGFRETHRANCTCLLGDRRCDSVYMKLDSPDDN